MPAETQIDVRTCTDEDPCAVHAPGWTGWICGGDITTGDLIEGFSPEMQRAAKGWVLSRTFWPRRTHPEWLGIVDCCERRVHLHETEAHLSIAFEGYVADWRFRCAPDRGCSVNANYRRTAHLRYYERA